MIVGALVLLVFIVSVLYEAMASLFDRPGRPSGRRTPAKPPGLSGRPPVPS
jgi:hypothetical protein